MADEPLSIDVFSDVICPWCYIGKRRLERALSVRPETRVAIRWRAFLLNPDMSDEGMGRAEYLERKFGTGARARDLYATIEDVGGREGLAFAFDRIRRTPSTLRAHRVIAAAWPTGRQDALVDILFKAYFEDGRDIGDDATLAAIGVEAGIDPEIVGAALADEDGEQGVHADNALAHAMGIGGVPCFIVNGRYAIVGAQEPEVFGRLLDGVRTIAGAAD